MQKKCKKRLQGRSLISFTTPFLDSECKKNKENIKKTLK